ncbi:MAG: hypothetical protein GY757_09635 [bacterium]|nr:hypothetical protein [bacterium]
MKLLEKNKTFNSPLRIDEQSLKYNFPADAGTSGGESTRKRISVLCNSNHYFLERAIIIEDTDGYRLIVMAKGRFFINEKYQTGKGARIAFLKIYGYKYCKPGVIEAEWTPLYYTKRNDWLLKQLPELPRAAAS